MLFKKLSCVGFCLTVMLTSSLFQANPLSLAGTSVYVPECLGKLSLCYEGNSFYLEKDGAFYQVQNCYSDSRLRGITSDCLEKFLKYGYIAVNQMDNGAYTLRAQGRLCGGGPLTASALYWVTKSACYGTAVAAASTAVVVTGGAAVGALTTAGVAAATGGAGIGAAAVSGAIAATTGGTAAAATATAATVTAAGGIAGAAAAVETASMAAFAFGMWLPLP
jgi:hypothetical protein